MQSEHQNLISLIFAVLGKEPKDSAAELLPHPSRVEQGGFHSGSISLCSSNLMTLLLDRLVGFE